MNLIINADDLGWNPNRDLGIFELFEKNAISSASAVVNGVNSVEAISHAKKCKYQIGLHLNLTEGVPLNAKNLS